MRGIQGLPLSEQPFPHMPQSQTDSACGAALPGGRPDKLNSVDFRWFVVRSLPHQERLLAGLLRERQADTPNILEVYCPGRTTVRALRGGRETEAPLLAGFVFVLSTHAALSGFLARHYPSGAILYRRRTPDGGRGRALTVPEGQMRFFMDFNDAYADDALVLERPFSDYAFNPRTGECNDMVRVLDGPLAGREGYLTRYRRGRRLVFNMASPGGRGSLAVSVPFDWSLRVVRIEDTSARGLRPGARLGLAADLLAGLLQGSGHVVDTLPMLHNIISSLAARPSLRGLCSGLAGQGHRLLAERIMGLGAADAGLILALARYERDNPGYLDSLHGACALRPFLTPTAGPDMSGGEAEGVVMHPHFTEHIRRVTLTEQVRRGPDGATSLASDYYAHVCVLPPGRDGSHTVFANWSTFLGEYFLTAGRANERLTGGTVHASGPSAGRLMESFRNFAPTLHRVLSGADADVRAVRGLRIGDGAKDVLAVTSPDVGRAKDTLTATGLAICTELSSGVRLPVWRRYLRTVWLHR